MTPNGNYLKHILNTTIAALLLLVCGNPEVEKE